ncbi:hypothetical protein HPB48_008919 [Haemaphysalis longicornis]|uniref:Uncharacterized protein n=1 Tax=Haemaphysalis longicornis TaxID=44386 RepID=A0A9J6GU39_HAELO|nr:hypothetical protein HPB48_008919 [Haemaphysalis longicornis]
MEHDVSSPVQACYRIAADTSVPQSPVNASSQATTSTTDDFKIGIRSRNGLQLCRADPILLTASIARVIGLQKLVVFGSRHEVSVYPITPDNSCRGVIHNIAQGHPEEYVKSLITTPGYEVLTARRLGDVKAFIITFRGKGVPFYVYVNQALLRCYHYRRTCKACGVTLNEPQHICPPGCGLCKGPHITASKDMPQTVLAHRVQGQENCKQVHIERVLPVALPLSWVAAQPGTSAFELMTLPRQASRATTWAFSNQGHSNTRERPPSQTRNRGTTPVTQREPPRDQRSTSCSVNTGTGHKEPRQEESPTVMPANPTPFITRDEVMGILSFLQQLTSSQQTNTEQLQSDHTSLQRYACQLRGTTRKNSSISKTVHRVTNFLPPPLQRCHERRWVFLIRVDGTEAKQ